MKRKIKILEEDYKKGKRDRKRLLEVKKHQAKQNKILNQIK